MHLADRHHRHSATNTAPLIDQSAARHTPAAGSHRALRTGEPPLPASQQASPFFELMSRNMALSNICSAYSFFSLPFSSSNAHNRFTSEGSMPPYFDLYLWNVAELIPCRRHTSAIFSPTSCSLIIAIIYSSVNRAFFCPSFCWADSTQIWRSFRGSGQIQAPDPHVKSIVEHVGETVDETPESFPKIQSNEMTEYWLTQFQKKLSRLNITVASTPQRQSRRDLPNLGRLLT